jgi:hypothetical protein
MSSCRSLPMMVVMSVACCAVIETGRCADGVGEGRAPVAVRAELAEATNWNRHAVERAPDFDDQAELVVADDDVGVVPGLLGAVDGAKRRGLGAPRADVDVADGPADVGRLLVAVAGDDVVRVDRVVLVQLVDEARRLALTLADARFVVLERGS